MIRKINLDQLLRELDSWTFTSTTATLPSPHPLLGKRVEVAVICPLLRDEQQTSKLRTTAKALHGADLSFPLLESKLLFSSRSEEDEEKVCCQSLCPSSPSSLFSDPRLATSTPTFPPTPARCHRSSTCLST